jgi:hypothetical protein
MVFEGAASVQLGRGTWHPRFGVTEENSCISAVFAGSALASLLTWPQLR